MNMRTIKRVGEGGGARLQIIDDVNFKLNELFVVFLLCLAVRLAGVVVF